MKHDDFAKALKDKKLKITPQRIAILEELDKNGHSSIDDVFTLIKNRIPSVSLATIYKNILAMQNANIIKSIKTPTQKQKYEINKTPHIHLFCRVCDQLEDFEIDIDEFSRHCQMQSGYTNINDASILLTGVCKKCQKDSHQKLCEM